MEIWMDTGDADAISAMRSYGIVYGVTTNPSILAKANDSPEKVINNLLEAQDGPVAVQVFSDEAEAMVREALALRAISDRIVVKVPVTQQGLMTIRQLNSKKIPVMATTVFQITQALSAALAGADYLAPYVSRMYNSGIDAIESLRIMQSMYDRYQFKTKLIGAALQSMEQVIACVEIGIAAMTLKDSVFQQFIADDPYTLESLEGFAVDWEKSKRKFVLK